MFKLNATPTFKVKVPIPIPGGKPQEIEFEFRHRTGSQLDEWANSEQTKAKDNSAFLMDLLAGWHDVDEAFSKEAVEKLCENYLGAAFAIREAYMRELIGAKLGN